MIDFTGVKYITIPEGKVAKIMRGSEVLWEKITKKYQKELAYIESTGTQWIDVGIIPNNLTSLELTVSGVSDGSFSSSTGTWFLGARKAYLNNAFGFYYNQSTQNFYYAFGNVMPNAFYSSSLLYGNVRTIRLDSTGLYVDGSKVVSMTPKAFTSPVPLSLFGLNNDGTVVSRTLFRCHSMKVWDGDNLIRDMIPVLDSNNVPCMYDIVSDQFYYNEGTGQFEYGYKYTPVAYLETTGTQYIKTDISLTQDSSFEMAITPLKAPSQPSAFFGARGGNASTQYIGIAFGTDRSVAVDFNNSNYNNFRALTYASLNQEYIFSGNKNERKIINASGSVVASNTRICNDTINTDVVSIFTQSGVASTWSYATARLRYLKIWNNDELVHDIIPVLDGNSIPCLMDTITEKKYYNDGTGEFLYGFDNAPSTFSLNRRMPEMEEIDPTKIPEVNRVEEEAI